MNKEEQINKLQEAISKSYSATNRSEDIIQQLEKAGYCISPINPWQQGFPEDSQHCLVNWKGLSEEGSELATYDKTDNCFYPLSTIMGETKGFFENGPLLLWQPIMSAKEEDNLKQ
jgi:hypothetical protein